MGILRRVRDKLAAECADRFSNRSVLEYLGWLDVSRWPRLEMNMEISKVWTHLQGHFIRLGCSLESVQEEMKTVVTVLWESSKPVADPFVFWQSVIRNASMFPSLHVFLRCCLALTPSNAVVERAFSKLTRILEPGRVTSDQPIPMPLYVH